MALWDPAEEGKSWPSLIFEFSAGQPSNISVPQKQPSTPFRLLECQELGCYMRPLQVVTKSGPSPHVHNNIKHTTTHHTMSTPTESRPLRFEDGEFNCPATFGEKVLNSFTELYWGESLPVGRCVRHRPSYAPKPKPEQSRRRRQPVPSPRGRSNLPPSTWHAWTKYNEAVFLYNITTFT
jgi:hypothetical protein